jgi:hypothetical protein
MNDAAKWKHNRGISEGVCIGIFTSDGQTGNTFQLTHIGAMRSSSFSLGLPAGLVTKNADVARNHSRLMQWGKPSNADTETI